MLEGCVVKFSPTLGSLPTWQVMEAPLLEEGDQGDRETWITLPDSFDAEDFLFFYRTNVFKSPAG